MRTSRLIILLIFCISVFQSCIDKRTNYYFYNIEGTLKKDTLGTVLSYSIIKPVYTSWDDSIKIEISNKGYFLMHHLKNSKTHLIDTVIIKPLTFLDSIVFQDSNWFECEENLQNFWNTTEYINDGASDSLRIFIIESKPGTDSLLLRRVHRFYMPGREG